VGREVDPSMSDASWWRRLRSRLRHEPARGTAPTARVDDGSSRVADSLRSLLDDPAIPPSVRSELAVAVFGRVSAGKSALGNALLGREAFRVGVLHGTTTDAEHAVLDEAQHDGLVLIDTPGI